LRTPVLGHRAMRDVDARHVRDRLGCRLRERPARGDHRIEQRQTDGRSHASKDRATREMLLRNEHGAQLLYHSPLGVPCGMTCAVLTGAAVGPAGGAVLIRNSGLDTIPMTIDANR